MSDGPGGRAPVTAARSRDSVGVEFQKIQKIQKLR
jgi:hypothetical protein